ncbi:MAG: translation initiation factor 2 [Eubacteriales bacterium]|nr:translation initiation factor 2 [Eubacteriales bacterium]
MKGKHHISVESLHLKYEFEIRRNITIIQGDSATGKTTLIDLLREYNLRGELSPVRLESDVPCIVFDGTDENWKLLIRATKGSIIFIDEGYSFIFSEEFADVIAATNNYYVLITRRPLICLPYSVKEIYGIRTTGKYHFPEQVYHEFYQLYEEEEITGGENVLFITEDSGSGYQFFKQCCSGRLECISADGNGNIYQTLKALPSDGKIVVIADGAAFGAYIAKVMTYAESRRNILLYLPESFEWMILKSGVIKTKDIRAILNHPEEYIESSQYFSWERFFTAYLEQVTNGDRIRHYQKNKLGSFYVDGRNKDMIVDVFPEAIKEIINNVT